MRWYLWRCALAVSLGLASGAWLIGCGDDATPTQPAAIEPAPTAVSPTAALRRLEWLFDYRSVDVYRTLLSDDFRFFCSPTDSAGNSWRGTPWTREDELAFATHFFLGGGPEHPVAGVRLTLDRNFFIDPDPEFPWDMSGRWHRTVRSTFILHATFAGGDAIELQGRGSFGLVRGDSAAIPDELLLRGVGRDSTRWYLRRWADETAEGPGPLRAGQPASNTTVCEIKSRYR